MTCGNAIRRLLSLHEWRHKNLNGMNKIKNEFVFRTNFLKRLADVFQEQPSAGALYFKILVNANARESFVNGMKIARGQLAIKYKTEKVFFNTSRKRFRKDRFYLVQKKLIESNRVDSVTILTVNNYDAIAKPLMPEI